MRGVVAAVVDHGVGNGELDRAVAELDPVGVHGQLLAVALRLGHRDVRRERAGRHRPDAVEEQPLPVEVLVNQTHVCLPTDARVREGRDRR